MFKDRTLHEQAKLELRAEFFNLLNHTNFNRRTRCVHAVGMSPTAGAMANTSTTSRRIRFAAKLLW